MGSTTPGDFRITAVNLEPVQHCSSVLAVIYLTPMASPGSQIHIFTQFIQIPSGLPVPDSGAGKAPGPGAGTIHPPWHFPDLLLKESVHISFSYLFLVLFLVNIKDISKKEDLT